MRTAKQVERTRARERRGAQRRLRHSAGQTEEYGDGDSDGDRDTAEREKEKRKKRGGEEEEEEHRGRLRTRGLSTPRVCV